MDTVQRELARLFADTADLAGELHRPLATISHVVEQLRAQRALQAVRRTFNG